MQDIIESTPELDMDLIGYKPCRCTTKNLPSDSIFYLFIFFERAANITFPFVPLPPQHPD